MTQLLIHTRVLRFETGTSSCACNTGFTVLLFCEPETEINAGFNMIISLVPSYESECTRFKLPPTPPRKCFCEIAEPSIWYSEKDRRSCQFSVQCHDIIGHVLDWPQEGILQSFGFQVSALHPKVSRVDLDLPQASICSCFCHVGRIVKGTSCEFVAALKTHCSCIQSIPSSDPKASKSLPMD